jgi:membrane protease YdiL (CAAX protease family)
MHEDPIISIIGLAVGAFFLWLWIQDFRQNRSGAATNQTGAMPGATMCNVWLWICALAIGLVWALGTTLVEFKLGLSLQQETISMWFMASMLGAAVTEEVIFRGYLVLQKRGAILLVVSIVGFSTLFALIHPYLWTVTNEDAKGLEWVTSLRFGGDHQAWLATGSIWLLSLLLYGMRFNPWNPHRSLLPCFVMHGAANIAVFGVKYLQGFVE